MNIVNTIIVNSLIINFIFNFTNKYINILITSAVVIAFPVSMLDNIPLPSKSSKPPLVAFTRALTKVLLISNKNLTKKGASAIATPPNNNRNKLSLASFLLDMLLPDIITLYESITTAISISVPDKAANILYQRKTLAQVMKLKGARSSFNELLLNIKLS